MQGLMTYMCYLQQEFVEGDDYIGGVSHHIHVFPALGHGGVVLMRLQRKCIAHEDYYHKAK